MVYFGAPRQFTDDDVQLAKTVASHIAFALERQASAAALREAETQYRMLVEKFPSVIHYISQPTDSGASLYISPQVETLLGFAQAECTTIPDLWANRLHPEDRERELALRRSHYIAGQPYSSEYRFLARDGRTVWLHDEAIPILDASGRLTAYHGVILDITARKQAEAEAARSHSLIAALNEVGTRLQTSLDPVDVMNTLGAELKRLGVTCFVALLEPETGSLILRYTSVESAQLAMVETLTGLTGNGFLFSPDAFPGYTETIEQGRAIFIRDSLEVAKTLLPQLLRSLADDVARIVQVSHATRGISLPLRTKSRTLGVLELWGDELRELDVPVFSVFASQVAMAIQNSQLYEAVYTSHKELEALSRRLVEVQENERRSLARELHDEIGQALTGIRLVLEMAAQSPPEAAAHLAEAQTLVSGLTRQVQTLSLSLRPAMLDDLGLLPTLIWHFERYTAQTGIQIDFQHGRVNRRFDPKVETAMYRIVQEALTNVARHAGVQEAAVRVWADSGTLNVEIADEGRGFNIESTLAARHSTGLSSMRERAALLGGRWMLQSAPGRGTRVTAEIPIHDHNPAG
jgi:PAS domain S-box-containing protein